VYSKRNDSATGVWKKEAALTDVLAACFLGFNHISGGLTVTSTEFKKPFA